MSFHLAKLHPNLVDDRDSRHQGLLLTRQEKERVISDFYAQQQHIPLCVDHCNATRGGFVVPPEERIGRVLDLFNDRHGQMLVKFQLDGTHPTFSPLMRGMHELGEQWGVSVWIDVARDGRTGSIKDKQLTHVALTQDPYFANHNTFLRDWSPTSTGIDSLIVKKALYSEGQGECYATDALKAKLKGVCILNSLAPSPTQAIVIVDKQKQQQSRQMDVETQPTNAPQQPAESDGDQVLKKQRLADEQGQQRQRQVSQQVPTFDECDMENAGQVNRAFQGMMDFMQLNPSVASANDAFMDRYADLRVQKKKHDEVFKAQIRQMQEHGFDLAKIEQMKPEQIDTFYDYVACSRKAMEIQAGEISRLTTENTRLQQQQEQVTTYTTKSTKTQSSAALPVQQALTGERREKLQGAYYDSLFADLKKPNSFTKQHDPQFAQNYASDLSLAQSMTQRKLQGKC